MASLQWSSALPHQWARRLWEKVNSVSQGRSCGPGAISAVAWQRGEGKKRPGVSAGRAAGKEEKREQGRSCDQVQVQQTYCEH